MSDALSYDGLDEAELILALYRGTSPLGMGLLHDKPDLDVQQVREDFGLDPKIGLSGNTRIRIDYYRGRPLKMQIDREAKTFTTALYDRDAGRGAAQYVLDQLRGRALVANT